MGQLILAAAGFQPAFSRNTERMCCSLMKQDAAPAAQCRPAKGYFHSHNLLCVPPSGFTSNSNKAATEFNRVHLAYVVLK